MVIDPEQHEVVALTPRFPVVERCRVVEIGCGDGRVTRRYCDRVTSVLAIDPDDAAIAAFRATDPAPKVDLRALPIERVDLPSASADAVLFSWSL
jgi:16S rRNA A1518/A1519 N6-dimethyltransferase RsmA/KsgA/DIM1 with predicted DNA glycosylase/AP lyase activity